MDRLDTVGAVYRGVQSVTALEAVFAPSERACSGDHDPVMNGNFDLVEEVGPGGGRAVAPSRVEGGRAGAAARQYYPLDDPYALLGVGLED